MDSFSKERLFELIGREEVVIFAGAGLSLYAGYPNGNKLRDLLWESLPQSGKIQIDMAQNLMSLSQNVYDLYGGRNHLITTLKDIFLKKPKSNDTHELISKLPHFRTIITTNYDTLFEQSYRENAQVFLNDVDLAYAEKSKVQIFKIHGDLSDPDSIILTNNDYNNFFKNDSENKVLWTSVREKISSKSILFIGYSLEDANIQVIFDKILDNLGDNMKECFFVSPSIPEFQLNKLIRKRIKYIAATGQELFSDLKLHLEKNTFIDLENGKVTAEVVKEFVQNSGYNVDLRSSIAGFYLSDIQHESRNVKQKANFAVNDKNIIEKLTEFVDGRTLNETFTLRKEELVDFNFYADEFRLRDYNSIQELTIMKLPNFEGKVDLIFESGYELEELPVTLRMTILEKGVTNFKVDTTDLILTITSKFNGSGINFTMNIDYKKTISSVSSYLNFNKALEKFLSGEKMTILANGEKVISEKSSTVIKSDPDDFIRNYFQKLKKIEIKFGVKFKDIILQDVNPENMATLDKLISKIDNVFGEINFQPITAYLSDTFDKGILKINERDHVMFFKEDIFEEAKIHGHTFPLGYKEVYIHNAIITNMDDLKNGTAMEMKIHSKSKTLKYCYRDKFQPLANETELQQ